MCCKPVGDSRRSGAKLTPETLTTACQAASWLAPSRRCGWSCGLDRARKLPLSGREKLPGDVGPELRRLDVATGGGLRCLVHAGNEVRDWDEHILHGQASLPRNLGCRCGTGRYGVHAHAGGESSRQRRDPPSDNELRIGIRIVGYVLHVRTASQEGFHGGGSVALEVFGREGGNVCVLEHGYTPARRLCSGDDNPRIGTQKVGAKQPDSQLMMTDQRGLGSLDARRSKSHDSCREPSLH